jgi:hypothetical protein
MTLNLMNIIILFASGLLAVTTIDVLGSVSSRRMNYRYVYLTPISFLVYFCMGYQGHFIATLPWILVIVCLTGIYDGTIGWRLSIILNANFADKEEYTKNLTLSSRISGMIVMSGIFGFLGFMTAGHI